MSRKNFYELLNEMKFDIRSEYHTLYDLFVHEKCCVIGFSMHPLVDYVNDYFRELPFRGTFINVESMMADMGIIDGHGTLNGLFLFCEFLLAVLPGNKLRDTSAKKQAVTIVDNITAILEKTNHRLLDKGDSQYIIVEKSKEASQAAELIEETSVAIEVLEYNHYALKGNLTRKRQILNDIANYVEPILKSRKFQGTAYNSVASNAGFFLNMFHIRHNNKEGAKAQDYIVGLNDSKLEVWYDKIYNVLLSVIILDKQIDIDSELSELKKNYNWKS